MKILDVPQSGSVAGTTSSHNRYGQYRRTRAIPTNPSTPGQDIARGNFAQVAQTWRTLTAPQREAWASWAEAHPIIDKLGQSQILTPSAAYQMITASWLKLNPLSAPWPTDPPLDMPAPVSGLTTFVYDLKAGEGFTLNVLDSPEAGLWIELECSGPQSAGTSVARAYKLVKLFTPAFADGEYDATTDYTGIFGVPLEGQRIHYRWRYNRGGLRYPWIGESLLVVDTTP